ncbi:hypothetical protein JTE90_006648 [Oedothorax gibbosus]|uniref:Uncharacterized protein n=1 Tax=Oedothorax gibbosus TaxID=931172 RepID=A0AAV6TML1_9ARAC|nr:hypothetical protein JTE90_006648 [Oedothorax gibbosus]
MGCDFKNLGPPGLPLIEIVRNIIPNIFLLPAWGFSPGRRAAIFSPESPSNSAVLHRSPTPFQSPCSSPKGVPRSATESKLHNQPFPRHQTAGVCFRGILKEHNWESFTFIMKTTKGSGMELLLA